MKKVGFLLAILFVIPQHVFAGFDLGTLGNAIFWIALLSWSAFVSALLLERKNQLSTFGAGVISAFIPKHARVVRVPHITVREASVSSVPKVATVLQSVPKQTAETHTAPTIAGTPISPLRPSTKIYRAALARSVAKNTLAGKKILSRSRGVIATQARDAVTIYKNIWRDIWHLPPKKPHAPSPELKKIDAVLADSHAVTPKITSAHVENHIEKIDLSIDSPEIFAEEVDKIHAEPESILEEQEIMPPEELHVVPEVATKIALVEEVQPKIPIIEFVPAPEVKDHERSREQALMRAQRAILRARNAQEGLAVVPTGALATPKHNHKTLPLHTYPSPVVETGSFADDLDSSEISEELKNFKARVAEVESRNHAVTHSVTATLRNNTQAHLPQNSMQTKNQLSASDAPHTTKDVVTLDVSSGTPKLVLTRHNL